MQAVAFRNLDELVSRFLGPHQASLLHLPALQEPAVPAQEDPILPDGDRREVGIGGVAVPRGIESQQAQQARQAPEVHVEDEPRPLPAPGAARTEGVHRELVVVGGTVGEADGTPAGREGADLGVGDAEVLDDRAGTRSLGSGHDDRVSAAVREQLLEIAVEPQGNTGHRATV